MLPKADRVPWFGGRARDPERGDVPGWVLITLMSAGLVVALWAVAGPLLENAFRQAITSVTGNG
ncbi:hypothetical protein [Myceligenerans xiligouense]|uniref:Flp pilus assembly pilin Flp n=1 Tax=Myceligenerans xiligouense TaxID=253184 RepID=A0A3N4Z995_9MICO|nr:hypothetical protein [Myceligenerans xiligouense]RPF22438.1 hypothetical protein EDD34_3099 [Myceligenerans xiligouense]